MNFEKESPSVSRTTVAGRTTGVPPKKVVSKCPSRIVLRTAAKPHSGECTSIVMHSDAAPCSSVVETAPPVLRTTKSFLKGVSTYLNTGIPAKRRHSPYERDTCCIHHENDGSNLTAVRTLEELKAFVHNDVAEMLRPIWNGISTLKTGLENPAGGQPVPLQMVDGDLQIPDEDGAVMTPGSSSVLTSESDFYSDRGRQSNSTGHAQSDVTLSRLPMLVQEVNRYPTATREHICDPTAVGARNLQAPTAAELDWCRIKLREANREIEALQATIYDLVGYQQKITVEFEKLQRHLCSEAEQARPSSSSFPDGRPTLYLDLLDCTIKEALAAVDSFTADFVAFSEERFHFPANRIWKPNFRDVFLAKESHWTFALKAFFCEKMFVGFENETFMTDAASILLDPASLRKECYSYFKRATAADSPSPPSSISSSKPALPPSRSDAHFKVYCKQKFDSIVPDAIMLHLGDHEENSPVGPTDPEINLSKGFLTAATKIWTLHKLCLAFEPSVSIFRARRGAKLDVKYMESVVGLEEDEMFVPKVGFMITPGFRLRDSTIKSQIYPAGRIPNCHRPG